MRAEYNFLPGVLVCRHNPLGWSNPFEGKSGDHNVCDKCTLAFSGLNLEINMGFDFSCIEVLWIDKQNNFKGSLQKKDSQADTNNVEYRKALKKFIESGKIFVTPNLKIIYV